MKFSVSTKAIKDAKARLRRGRISIEREQPKVLEAVGVKVLSLSQQAYREKSRGATGGDGIKWKPLDPKTIKAKNRRGKRNFKRKTTKSGKARPGMGQSAIGIDTGLQLASASPGFAAAGGGNILRLSSTSVTVGYGRSYSKHFDAVRPLLPKVLPAGWRKACEDIVLRWASALLKGGGRG